MSEGIICAACHLLTEYVVLSYLFYTRLSYVCWLLKGHFLVDKEQVLITHKASSEIAQQQRQQLCIKSWKSKKKPLAYRQSCNNSTVSYS